MKSFVAGANGATGCRLVRELLNRGVYVKTIVRGAEKLPFDIRTHKNIAILETNILQLCDCLVADYIKDCDAVASCLGHNVSLKGIFGNPKYLVTDSVIKLCQAINRNSPERPVKFLLLNTTAVKNKDDNEKFSLSEELLIALSRRLLPPQRDNERAADFLKNCVENTFIKWTIVRPDTLINENFITEYGVFPSHVCSPVFDAGKTSRINVAHFMSELITNEIIWEKWEGKMPVIYNSR